MKHILFLACFLFSLPAVAAAPFTHDEALRKVEVNVRGDKIYPWATMGCITYEKGKSDAQYYYVTLYEKHQNGCPGDPQTAPKLDTYRVHIKTQQIELLEPGYEPGQGKWIKAF